MPTLTIEFDDPNFGPAQETGIRVYRSTSAIDPENLPVPLAELPPDITEYADSTVEEGEAYYYAISHYIGSMELVSLQAFKQVTGSPPIDPPTPIEPPTPLAPSYILSQGLVAYDLTEGWPLYEKDKDTREDPASVIKLLTAYVAIQAKSGVLDSETVTVTSGEAATAGSSAGLMADDILTYDALLYAMVLPSGNDAAEAIARAVGDDLSGGGGRTRFLAEMNTVAASVGVTGATIEDVGGGNGPGTNALSADEIRRIVELIAQEPLLIPYFSTAEISISVTGPNARTIDLEFTHERVTNENFVFGKTGTTSTDQGSLVTVFTAPNGNEIAIVQLHTAEAGGFRIRRYYDMAAVQYMLMGDFPYLQQALPGDPHYGDILLLVGGDEDPVVDESDNAITLTDSGVALTTPVVGASAIDFNGGESLSSSDALLHMEAEDFTIEFFLRGAGSEPPTGYLLSRYNTTGNQREFGIQYSASVNEFRLWVSNDGSTRFNAAQNVDPNTFFNGAPRHIIAQRHGSNWSVWINGQRGLLSEVENAFGSLHTSTEPFRIGSADWDDIIDEVRITKGTARYPKTTHPISHAIVAQKHPRNYAPGERALLIVAGQSNPESSKTEGETVPVPEQFSDSDVRIWNVGSQAFETYSAATNSNEYNDGAVTPQKWGPEAKFALDFRAAHPNIPLDIVKICVSGSNLETNGVDDWDPDNTGELFEDLEANVAAAQADIASEFGGSAPVNALMWWQGENDAELLSHATDYYNNLLAFEAAIHSRIGDTNTNLALFRIAPSAVKTYASTVRAAQGRFVRDAAGSVTLVDTDFFDHDVDTYHVSVAGVTEGGEAGAQVYDGTYPFIPVRFSSISSDKNSNIALSGSNLIAEGSGTSSSGHQSIRSDTFIHYSDKSYFEIECTQLTGNMVIGMGATPNLTSYWGSKSESVGYAASGNCYDGASVLDVYASYTTGDVVMVAHDGATGQVWFGKNGTWNGDPAAGTGEFTTLSAKSSTSMHRFGVTLRRSNDIATIQTTPNYTVPTGYTHHV